MPDNLRPDESRLDNLKLGKRTPIGLVLISRARTDRSSSRFAHDSSESLGLKRGVEIVMAVRPDRI